MKIDDTLVGKLLVDEAYITAEALENAKTESQKHHMTVVEYLLSTDKINKEILGQALAEKNGLPYADFSAHGFNGKFLNILPEDFAKEHRVVPFKVVDKGILYASDDPKAEGLQEQIKKFGPKKNFKVIYALSSDIDEALAYYRKPLETRFSKIIAENVKIAPEIIDEIINEAIASRSSDIHLEPQADNVLIRFRVDGVLQEAGKIPLDQYDKIVNRVKILSDLRIDEHKAIQDGSIHSEINNNNVDLRVSVVPTIGGEKVVIRILTEYVQISSLADLGLSEKTQKIVHEKISKPHGMIVTTGPTGSGKTTTLYSFIRQLNSPDINITTIEDPVEYRIDTINQIQVDEETGITFARGLRSIVRQDPDVILVGEIRDDDTADIAVNASLTGHLVLTTMHANDCATAIPRFTEMGIEPFLLASTLELVIAQRLVRKICTACKVSYRPKADELANLHPKVQALLKGVDIFKGSGCVACSNTGYRGRQAIFEIMPISPAIRDLILKNPSSQEISKLAQSENSEPLYLDGIEKIKLGITTLEEVIRIAPVE